jgi:hypothetical protein
VDCAVHIIRYRAFDWIVNEVAVKHAAKQTDHAEKSQGARKRRMPTPEKAAENHLNGADLQGCSLQATPAILTAQLPAAG